MRQFVKTTWWIWLGVIGVVFSLYIHHHQYFFPPKGKHVYLGTKIGKPEEYIPLALKLQGFKGTLYVHLVGDGGNYTGVQYLKNLFSKSEKTVMIVDGEVHSGHAILALTGDELIISEEGYFMWHLVSGTNGERIYCSTKSGLDRGIDAREKCNENMPKRMKMYNDSIIKIVSKVLNEEEIERLKQGREVYLTHQEVRERL